MVGILIWYHNKQHFKLSDIVITRDYCIRVTLDSLLTLKALVATIDALGHFETG